MRYDVNENFTTINVGYAHGVLLAEQILEFTKIKLPEYYANMVLDIDVSGLPDGLQKIFEVIKIKGAKAAPEVFNNGN